MLYGNSALSFLLAGCLLQMQTTSLPIGSLSDPIASHSGNHLICSVLSQRTAEKTMADVLQEKSVPIATPVCTEPPVATKPKTTQSITQTESQTTTTQGAETTTQPAQTEPAAVPVSQAAQTFLATADTDFKAYMDFRTITDTSSQQYTLQQEAWTDDQGLRRMGEDYLVAMGTGWLEEGCGERFHVTLDSGNAFTVMIGDIKANSDTDANHLYHPCDCGENVLEFIVDTDILASSVRNAGTISAYEEFQGNIVEIQRLP